MTLAVLAIKLLAWNKVNPTGPTGKKYATMKLFPGMIEDIDGLPKIGPGGRLLGVRPGNFPSPDVTAINPPDLASPGKGGMSVAPDDPTNLPRHRKPMSLGGISSDPVWYIEQDQLGSDLRFRQDSSVHGVLEPARPMTLQELQDALAGTRNRWQVHCR
jgi:hypothetical protein